MILQKKFYGKLFLFFLIATCYSCTQKIYFLEGNKVSQNLDLDQGDIVVNAEFAGDAIDYIIFELTIKNNASDTFFIKTDDIIQRLAENDSSYWAPLHPLEKELPIAGIENRKDYHQKQKKFRTLNVVIGGLDILSAIISPGLSAGNRILYSLEPAVYLAAGHRSSKLTEHSIDEQLEYLEDWAFENTYVLAGAEGSWDLLFESVLINGSAQLSLENIQVSYEEKFDLFIDQLK